MPRSRIERSDLVAPTRSRCHPLFVVAWLASLGVLAAACGSFPTPPASADLSADTEGQKDPNASGALRDGTGAQNASDSNKECSCTAKNAGLMIINSNPSYSSDGCSDNKKRGSSSSTSQSSGSQSSGQGSGSSGSSSPPPYVARDGMCQSGKGLTPPSTVAPKDAPEKNACTNGQGKASKFFPANLSFRKKDNQSSIKLSETCSGGVVQDSSMASVPLYCDATKSQKDKHYKRVAGMFGLSTGQQYCDGGCQLCATIDVGKDGTCSGQIQNIHLRDSFTCEEATQHAGDPAQDDGAPGRLDLDGCTYQEVMALVANALKVAGASDQDGSHYWTDEAQIGSYKLQGGHLHDNALQGAGVKISYSVYPCVPEQ